MAIHLFIYFLKNALHKLWFIIIIIIIIVKNDAGILILHLHKNIQDVAKTKKNIKTYLLSKLGP